MYNGCANCALFLFMRFDVLMNRVQQFERKQCSTCSAGWRTTYTYFTSTWPHCIVTNFFIIKPTGCTNFQNLLWHETLHVSGSSSAHHQEFIHCTLCTGLCHTGLKKAFEQEHMFLLESCLQTCMTYNSAECTVNKLLMMGRGTTRNMQSFMPE